MTATTLRFFEVQPFRVSLVQFRSIATEKFSNTASIVQSFPVKLGKAVRREPEKAKHQMTLSECRLPTGELVFGGLASEQSLESLSDWGSDTASFILAFMLIMSTLWIVGG